MLQRKNRSQNSHVRIWILCLILFLSVVAYADRSILSISGSAIKQEFGLSAIQLGLTGFFGSERARGDRTVARISADDHTRARNG